MGTGVRIIIFNLEDDFRALIRGMLLQFDGVKIAAEVDQPAVLAQVVAQVPAEVLLVNLDPDPNAILTALGEIAANHPNVAVLATSVSSDGQLILEVMRKGIKDFLPKPIEEDALQQALQKVASLRVDAPPHGKIITVLSGSGGQGATMLATNLAVEMIELTKGKVTVVDLDYRFGQVATFLDIEPTYTLADLCSSVEQVEHSVIEKALIEHESGVRVLSRPTHLAQTESLSAASCVGILSTLVQFQDYVIVDGPTRFDVTARCVLDLADVNLMLVQCLVPSVRNTVRIIDGMREAGYNMDRMRLVCNRVGRDSSHLSVQDVSSTLNTRHTVQIPDDWATVGGAVNLGVPLATYSPKSKVRLAVRELAEQLHNPPEQTDSKESKKSLMSRIFAEK